MPVNPPVIYQRANERVWSYARPPDRKGQSDDLLLNIPFAIDFDTLYLW